MAAPKITPTASPSGILCSVMASTNNVVLCHCVLTPSASDSLKFICKWGITLSKAKRKIAPNKNPMTAGETCSKPSPVDISTAGPNKPKQLAATITPPVKPSIPSNTARFNVLKKNTIEAPAAVTNQVKVVAIKAPKIGLILKKKSTKEFHIVF